MGPSASEASFAAHSRHARAQSQQYPLDARGGNGGVSDYEYPPAFNGVEGVDIRQSARGPMGASGGSGESNVVPDVGGRSLPPASIRDASGDAGAPPPGFPHGYHEYVEYSGSIEYGGGNDIPHGDGRGGGHRTGMPLQHVQQQDHHHEQKRVSETDIRLGMMPLLETRCLSFILFTHERLGIPRYFQEILNVLHWTPVLWVILLENFCSIAA